MIQTIKEMEEYNKAKKKELCERIDNIKHPRQQDKPELEKLNKQLRCV